jgi:hypothetical protein
MEQIPEGTPPPRHGSATTSINTQGSSSSTGWASGSDASSTGPATQPMEAGPGPTEEDMSLRWGRGGIAQEEVLARDVARASGGSGVVDLQERWCYQGSEAEGWVAYPSEVQRSLDDKVNTANVDAGRPLQGRVGVDAESFIELGNAEGTVGPRQLRRGDEKRWRRVRPPHKTSMFLARANPKWIPPSGVECCMLCEVRFGMTAWKYNCRYCGWVVCAGCFGKAGLKGWVGSNQTMPVDRWVSSEAGHPLKLARELEGSPETKDKQVCKECLQRAPAEVHIRRRQSIRPPSLRDSITPVMEWLQLIGLDQSIMRLASQHDDFCELEYFEEEGTAEAAAVEWGLSEADRMALINAARELARQAAPTPAPTPAPAEAAATAIASHGSSFVPPASTPEAAAAAATAVVAGAVRPRGLPGRRHYCFLNATLQCLRHAPGVHQLLSSRGQVSDEGLLESAAILLHKMNVTSASLAMTDPSTGTAPRIALFCNQFGVCVDRAASIDANVCGRCARGGSVRPGGQHRVTGAGTSVAQICPTLQPQPAHITCHRTAASACLPTNQ